VEEDFEKLLKKPIPLLYLPDPSCRRVSTIKLQQAHQTINLQGNTCKTAEEWQGSEPQRYTTRSIKARLRHHRRGAGTIVLERCGRWGHIPTDCKEGFLI
jgi:hypothetical protein